MRWLVVLGWITGLTAVPAAQAHQVLITDATGATHGATVLDTSTNAFTRPAAFQTGAEGGGQIALSPDGKRAWTGTAGGGPIVRLDLAGRALLSPSFPVPGGNGRLAADPTASTLFAGTATGVLPVNAATGAAGTPVGPTAPTIDVIVDPAGRCGYASNQGSGSIKVFPAATGATCPMDFTLPGGSGHFSFTPDGSRLVVAEGGGSDTAVVNVNTTGVPTFTPVLTGFGNPRDVAVTPDGTRAYVVDGAGTQQLKIVNLGATPSVGASIPLTGLGVNGGQAIAISPDGKRAYVPCASCLTNDKVAVVDLAANVQVDTLTRPAAQNGQDVAVLPNQGPRAFVSAAPSPAGAATVLDGSASVDPDGSIARYDWDFGDGTGLADGGPAPAHVYSSAGFYTVTLLVTDNEGISTQSVWTGVPKINGGPEATASQSIGVQPPAPLVCCALRPTVSFLSTKVRIDSRGRGKVTMRCQAVAGDRCAIAGELRARVVVSSGRLKRKTLQVGSLSGTVPGRLTGKVSIVLGSRGKRAVKGGKRLSARVRGTSTNRGGTRETFSSTLTLQGPKPKKRKR